MKKDLRMYEVSKESNEVNLKELGKSLDRITQLAGVFIDSNNLYTKRDEYDRIIKTKLDAQGNDSMTVDLKYNDADNEIFITTITSNKSVSTHVIAESSGCSNFNNRSIFTIRKDDISVDFYRDYVIIEDTCKDYVEKVFYDRFSRVTKIQIIKEKYMIEKIFEHAYPTVNPLANSLAFDFNSGSTLIKIYAKEGLKYSKLLCELNTEILSADTTMKIGTSRYNLMDILVGEIFSIDLK